MAEIEREDREEIRAGAERKRARLSDLRKSVQEIAELGDGAIATRHVIADAYAVEDDRLKEVVDRFAAAPPNTDARWDAFGDVQRRLGELIGEV